LPVTSNLGVVVALLITGNEISRDSLPHESSVVVPLPKKHSGLKSLALLRHSAFQIVHVMCWWMGVLGLAELQEHFRNAFVFSQRGRFEGREKDSFEIGERV
jgi:hypothetical protein